jgi:hypothetical protein
MPFAQGPGSGGGFGAGGLGGFGCGIVQRGGQMTSVWPM